MAQDVKKKKKEPGRIRRWFKDFFSELKKVTWPTFGTVCKQTGIVLLVTLIFLLVVLAFDSLLGYLYGLLVSGLPAASSSTSVVTSALSACISVIGC